MYFKGDILITDPCYLKKDNEKGREDWRKSNGVHLSAFGLKKYLCRGTGYGDWSCHTFRGDFKKKGLTEKDVLGQFCADAGLVCVVLLDEVLKYNPEFDYHINRLWTTTLIKDFDGDIEIKEMGEGEDEMVSVIGKGNINFFTLQTGL